MHQNLVARHEASIRPLRYHHIQILHIIIERPFEALERYHQR